jgi:hypothetical protein
VFPKLFELDVVNHWEINHLNIDRYQAINFAMFLKFFDFLAESNEFFNGMKVMIFAFLAFVTKSLHYRNLGVS